MILSLKTKPAITSFISIPSPKPAGFSFANLRPYSLFRVFSSKASLSGATMATKLLVSVLGCNIETRITSNTLSWYLNASQCWNLHQQVSLWLGPRIRRNLICGLLVIVTSFPVCLAQGQQSSPAEVRRLQTALSQALDRLESLDTKLKAASEAIEALKEEREAATKTLEAAKAERESLERSVAIAERAIAAQKEAIAIYEKALAMQDKLIDRQAERIDKLETKLDKANSRTVKAGVVGFIAGVLAGLVKVF